MNDTTTTTSPVAALEALVTHAVEVREELLAFSTELAPLAAQIVAAAARYEKIREPLEELRVLAVEELADKVWIDGPERVTVTDAISTVTDALIADPIWNLFATMRDVLGDAIGDPT